MKEDIKKLIEKHKDFVNEVEKELIKENDDFGNARRIMDFRIEHKKKDLLDEEQELILNVMIDEHNENIAYKNYLEELDAPRWYLEKTYPTFYKHFEDRFNRFIDNWIAKGRQVTLDEEIRKKIFIDHCETIIQKIKNDIGIKAAFAYINKHGLPKEEKEKVSLIRDAFFQIRDELFELPELIIASFGHENDEWQKKQKSFVGNSLEKRKSKNLYKYNKTAKLIGIMETDYKYLKGIQTKACEMTDCNDKNFSKWINDSTYNYDLFHNWKKTIEDEEKFELKKEIEAYIKK